MLGLRFARGLSPAAASGGHSSSRCGGPLFIAVRGPVSIAAPPVAGHRLQTRRLSNCGSRAQPLRGTWDLPRPGFEPASPALAGRFSTTAPPGKPLCMFFASVYSPVKWLFMSFTYFLIGFFFFFNSWALRVFMYSRVSKAFVRYVIYKCLLPICSLSFYPLHRAKVFNFDEVHLISFSFCGSCFWCPV